MDFLHTGRLSLRLESFGAFGLNGSPAHQKSGFFTQLIKHIGEEVKGLFLIFNQRIFLTVSAQNNSVTH